MPRKYTKKRYLSRQRRYTKKYKSNRHRKLRRKYRRNKKHKLSRNRNYTRRSRVTRNRNQIGGGHAHPITSAEKDLIKGWIDQGLITKKGTGTGTDIVLTCGFEVTSERGFYRSGDYTSSITFTVKHTPSKYYNSYHHTMPFLKPTTTCEITKKEHSMWGTDNKTLTDVMGGTSYKQDKQGWYEISGKSGSKNITKYVKEPKITHKTDSATPAAEAPAPTETVEADDIFDSFLISANFRSNRLSNMEKYISCANNENNIPHTFVGVTESSGADIRTRQQDENITHTDNDGREMTKCIVCNYSLIT